MSHESKALGYLHEIWPYITGLFLVTVAMFKTWMHDRKRITTLEVLAENMVTHGDLQKCREDVRNAEEKQLQGVYADIKSLAKQAREDMKQNAKQHSEIMNQIIELHKNHHGE